MPLGHSIAATKSERNFAQLFFEQVNTPPTASPENSLRVTRMDHEIKAVFTHTPAICWIPLREKL